MYYIALHCIECTFWQTWIISQFLELWQADTVVVGLVLLNTAGTGLFSTSLTSPYNQQEFVSMLSSKTHLAKTW